MKTSVTKELLLRLTPGTVLYHRTAKNKSNKPIAARLSGRVKTLVRTPEYFKQPMRYGIYSSFYITLENADDWYYEEEGESNE